MKPSKRFFYILLAIMAAMLIALGFWGAQLERILSPWIVKNLPDCIMFAAVGILLWNRQILNKEKKAAAARKLEEEAAAAAKNDESEPDAPS
jgi:hypothetical protein